MKTDITNFTFKKFMKISISFLTLLFILLSINNTVYASDRSIVGDFFNKVFAVELTDGRTALETDQDVNEREKINNLIYEEKSDKKYSLYDRFGGTIKFIPYFGETKISTNLLDKFYQKYMDNDMEFSLSLDDIKLYFQKPAISNNVVYEGRPNVLTSEDIEGGAMDPRVYTYNGVSASGGDAALGNAYLTTSSTITSIIAWLSGSGLYKILNDIWVDACNTGITEILQSMVRFLLPLAMCGFVIRTAMYAFQLVKGTFALRTFITHISFSLISLGLVFSMMINPVAFGNILTNVTTIFDTVLDDALQVGKNEVVVSDQTDNVREATLWKKTIFDQWCYGMFGDKYENLYTTFDEDAINHKNGKKSMDQSHDNVKNPWNNGYIKYNSADLTGDVKVPIGNNNYIRNWAALAWSTQSIYHLDAVENETTNKNDKLNNVNGTNWPKALTTPMNDSIYVDNFRWIDAKLNISPEYHSVTDVRMNFTNSRNYEQNFVSSGLKSLYMTLLTIPIGILALRKVYYALLLITSGAKLCIQSVLALVWPTKYNLIQNIKNVWTPLYQYLWWSIIIFLQINIYDLITGKMIIGDFVWVLVAIYMLKFRPIRTPRQAQQLLNHMSGKARALGNNIINFAKSLKK